MTGSQTGSPSPAGQTLAQYAVLEKLGDGELGAVYLARQAGDVPAQALARSYTIAELGSDGYYMAFGAGTPDALVERLVKGLAAIKSNGTYDALKKKWL